MYRFNIIVRVVKSRRLRWTEHMSMIGRGKKCTQNLGGETS